MGVEFSRVHRFTSCHVTVTGEVRNDRPEVRLSAGATLTMEQALELAESIMAARRTLEGVTAASLAADLQAVRDHLEWQQAITGGGSTEAMHRQLAAEARHYPPRDEALAALDRIKRRNG